MCSWRMCNYMKNKSKLTIQPVFYTSMESSWPKVDIWWKRWLSLKIERRWIRNIMNLIRHLNLLCKCSEVKNNFGRLPLLNWSKMSKLHQLWLWFQVLCLRLMKMMRNRSGYWELMSLWFSKSMKKLGKNFSNWGLSFPKVSVSLNR